MQLSAQRRQQRRPILHILHAQTHLVPMPSKTKTKAQSPSFLLPLPPSRALIHHSAVPCSHSKFASRRKFLRFALASVLLPALRPSATHAREWLDSDLCGDCQGSGNQSCPICDGTGTLSIDDSVIQRADQCPNCMGTGRVRCLSCIGLGLADVNGILRDGSRDGRLRMLRNGAYEILDCSAFPSCDLYRAKK